MVDRGHLRVDRRVRWRVSGRYRSGVARGAHRAGFDLVTANSVKMVVSLTVTVIALPVFLLSGNIVWLPAIVLAAGFFVGGWCGAQVAVKGGEKLIRLRW